MAASSVLAFWGVAALLIAVPGPDWAFILGMSAGPRAVVPAVAGLAIGYTAVTAVVAAGVGAAVAGSPAVLTALAVVGGGYLMWQGAMIVARPPTASAIAGGGSGRRGGTLVRGVAVSALNPKALLMFLALLPQFTDPDWTWPVAAQIGLLGVLFTLSCAAFYVGLGLLASTLVQPRPAVARLSGAAMVVLGGALIAERALA
jgi:threonine/homoserine/homoserine lactone efflux protein